MYMSTSKKPSMAELIEILPNGEVRAKDHTTTQERGGRKPLTMRENLGGEYAES